MGHRTYLLKTSKEQSEVLFEANNSIPFFWLTLIDINAVEKSEPQLIKVWNLNERQSADYAEQNIDSASIKNSKTEFLKNAAEGATFINKHFPNEIKLYNDFISYLKLTFDSNDVLELSLMEMANFSNINILIQSLKNEINAINTNDISNITYHANGNIFSNLTGYDRFLLDKFRNHSTEYQIACDQEDNTRNVTKKKYIDSSRLSANKKRRSGIKMLVVGILFMVACILLITKEGMTTATVSTFIFCLTLLVVGYLKLK